MSQAVTPQCLTLTLSRQFKCEDRSGSRWLPSGLVVRGSGLLVGNARDGVVVVMDKRTGQVKVNLGAGILRSVRRTWGVGVGLLVTAWFYSTLRECVHDTLPRTKDVGHA